MSEFYRLIDVDKDNKELRKQLDYYKRKSTRLQQRIDKALNKINNMFDRGDANTIIDDLLELDKILKGEVSE